MKPKKNPRLDLNKKRILFFQIGLVLVLFISWRSIEIKTFAKEASIKTVYFEEFPDEPALIKYKVEKEKPKREIQKKIDPKTLKPREAKNKFKIVPDDKKQLLDSLYRNKTTAKTNSFSEPKLEPVDEVEPVAKVPLLLIQKSPVFPGCEGMESNAGRKACLTEKIHEFIKRNFDKGIASRLNFSGQILNIRVVFMLNNKGQIVEIEAKGPHPRLEKEAVRVIGMLPEISPGIQNGKAVNVLFSIPIVFEVK